MSIKILLELYADKNFVLIISIMLYIPKIVDYVKILTDYEMKDLVVINFKS